MLSQWKNSQTFLDNHAIEFIKVLEAAQSRSLEGNNLNGLITRLKEEFCNGLDEGISC